MQITILGTRGELRTTHPQYSKHSGILIDAKLLLDVGENEFLKYRPEFIFITHLHPDHAIFMSRGEKLAFAGPVYIPEKCEKLADAQVIRNTITINGYSVTPIPVTHSIKVRSLGYLIEKKGKRVFYTGDVASIEEEALKRLPRPDVVITEASFIRRGGLIRKDHHGNIFGHAGVPDLVDRFQKFTNRIVFTHFGTWFVKNVPSGIQRIKSFERNGLKIEVASDGASYEV